MMSEENIVKLGNDIVSHMKHISYRHAEIHFVGGEPTMLGLNFFQKAIPIFRNILSNNGFTFEVMMISNLLHQDILEIAKLFDRVTTSYEINTRFISLKGVFKPKLERQWLHNVKLLKDHGIDIGVTTAITKDVVNFGAPKILDYFYENDIKQIHFGFFIPEGDGLVNEAKIFPEFSETSNFLIESAKWYLDKREVDPNLWVNPFESMVSAIASNEPLDDIVCPIVTGSIDINWDGNCATCLEAGGAKNPEWDGNVLSESIIEVVTKDTFLKKVFRAKKPQAICRTCDEYTVCKSGCGVLFNYFDPNVDKECPGFKTFIKYVRECVNNGLKPRYEVYLGKSC